MLWIDQYRFTKPFSPDDIADLARWWDLSDSASVNIVSGNQVSGVACQITGTTNRLLRRDTTNPPLIHVAELNGLDVTDLGSGSNGFFSGALCYAAGECTVFAVMRVPTMSATGALIVESNNGTDDNCLGLMLQASSSGTIQSVYRNHALTNFLNDSAGLEIDDNAWHQLTFVDTGTDVTRRADGVTGTGDPFSYTRAGTVHAFSRLCVGYREMITDDRFLPNGSYLAELLVYTRALNGTEIGNVEDYLNSKWGL